MVKVSICVCTRKRPEGIATLLRSINNLIIPSDTELGIIVVENDSESYTKEIIEEIAQSSKFTIRYFLEKNPGISFARNRTVKESGNVDFCCFVDDDQSVDANWLIELFKCQKEFNSDGVWGPNPPVFSEEVPEYIRNFHLPELFSYGENVLQAYTNCLLIKKKVLDTIEGPFDIRLNFTGGEDCFLTKKIIADGGKIKFTPLAKAYEIIPKRRTKLKYMMKRTARTINTKYILEALNEPYFSKYSLLPRLLMRLVNGLIQTIPYYIFSNSDKYMGLLKISDAIGGIMFVFGRKNKFYK